VQLYGLEKPVSSPAMLPSAIDATAQSLLSTTNQLAMLGTAPGPLTPHSLPVSPAITSVLPATANRMARRSNSVDTWHPMDTGVNSFAAGLAWPHQCTSSAAGRTLLPNMPLNTLKGPSPDAFRRKRNRRAAQELRRKNACPLPGCERRYEVRAYRNHLHSSDIINQCLMGSKQG
jgi:hypothetical protein